MAGKPENEIPRHPDSPCRRCWRGPDCGDRIDKCPKWRDWFCRSWRRMQRMFGKSAEKHEREEIKRKEGRQ